MLESCFESMLSEMPVSDEHHTRSRSLWPGLLLAGFVVLVAAVVIASGRGGTSEASDQDKYHLPVIDAMVAQWPLIEISDYPSATSPGYHALLAGVRVALGESAGPYAVRAVSALFGALVPFACFLVASRYTPSWRAGALAAPLAASSYILGGSMYLTTDNLAYLFVLLTLALAMRPLSPARGALAGAGAVCAVAVRQIHLWTIAPLGMAGLLAAPLAPRLFPRLADDKKPCWRATAAAWAGCLAACALLGTFVALWGGLTPPAAAATKHAEGFNTASYALALALAGIFAPVLGGFEALRAWGDGGKKWILGGGAIGLLIGVAFPTSFELRHRAYGWLWKLVEKTPDVSERSLLMAGLAAVGGATLAGIACRAVRNGRGRETFILAIGGAGWLAAQSANSMAWQRYFEPMVLILSAWLVALAWSGAKTSWERLWAYGGGALLALAQLALSAATLGREVLGADAVNF